MDINKRILEELILNKLENENVPNKQILVTDFHIEHVLCEKWIRVYFYSYQKRLTEKDKFQAIDFDKEEITNAHRKSKLKNLLK